MIIDRKMDLPLSLTQRFFGLIMARLWVAVRSIFVNSDS